MQKSAHVRVPLLSCFSCFFLLGVTTFKPCNSCQARSPIKPVTSPTSALAESMPKNLPCNGDCVVKLSLLTSKETRAWFGVGWSARSSLWGSPTAQLDEAFSLACECAWCACACTCVSVYAYMCAWRERLGQGGPPRQVKTKEKRSTWSKHINIGQAQSDVGQTSLRPPQSDPYTGKTPHKRHGEAHGKLQRHLHGGTRSELVRTGKMWAGISSSPPPFLRLLSEWQPQNWILSPLWAPLGKKLQDAGGNREGIDCSIDNWVKSTKQNTWITYHLICSV